MPIVTVLPHDKSKVLIRWDRPSSPYTKYIKVKAGNDTSTWDKELIDAQNEVRGILAYAKQEMILRLATRAANSDANDKVSQAMLARYGEIGEDKSNINLQISVAGASTSDVDEWSK